MGNKCGLCNAFTSFNRSKRSCDGNKANMLEEFNNNKCNRKSKNPRRYEKKRNCKKSKYLLANSRESTQNRSVSKNYFPGVKFDVVVSNPNAQSIVPITLVDNETNVPHNDTTTITIDQKAEDVEETIYSMGDINLSLEAEHTVTDVFSIPNRSNKFNTENIANKENDDSYKNITDFQNNGVSTTAANKFSNRAKKVSDDCVKIINNNMSFTNSFIDVDNDAVAMFVNNVLQINKSLDEVGLLEESVLAPAMFADPALQASYRNTRLALPGLTPGLPFTSEDNEYIEWGGEEEFKLQRLCEVEYATRQNIINAWNISNRFLELGAARMVPTLRTRRTREIPRIERKVNGVNTNATNTNYNCSYANGISATKLLNTPETDVAKAEELSLAELKRETAAQKRKRERRRRPVLVIHAGDVQLDSGSFNLVTNNFTNTLPLSTLTSTSTPISTKANASTAIGMTNDISPQETKEYAKRYSKANEVDQTVSNDINTCRWNSANIDDSNNNRGKDNRIKVDTFGDTIENKLTSTLTFTAAPLSLLSSNATPRTNVYGSSTNLIEWSNTGSDNNEINGKTNERLQKDETLQKVENNEMTKEVKINNSVAKSTPRGHGNEQYHADNYGEQVAAYNTSFTTQANRTGYQNKAIEHFEVLALSCQGIYSDDKVNARVEYNTWDFLSHESNAEALTQGDCIFRFICKPTDELDEDSLDLIDTFINVTAFSDELQQNNTPTINIRRPEYISRYICIMVKSMYLLPNARISDISASLIASKEYQKACQPSGNKVEDTDSFNTFRINMTIIRFIFSMKVQFLVSEVTDPGLLQSFRIADGIVPAKAICLERTKRNIEKTDATIKARSILLYYPVNGGVLVSNQSIILNTSLPTIVSKIVNSFGSQGASQSAETARLARKYFSRR